ncbi:MAG: arylsulfatase [Saprospiraceae bacterium]|nr:arylsulfatase [Saprospiraceae bacterium]
MSFTTHQLLIILSLCTFLVLTACRNLGSERSLAQEAPPNVILIYADDLGIGMLGCYGQKVVTTPHIDRLAAEGLRFTNYYGSTFCAPARYSLATGMHDGRINGWKHSNAGLIVQRDAGRISEEAFQKRFAKLKANARPIQEDEVFLGQVAQDAGYHTAQFGKLDSGFLTWSERVKRFGWDHHEGYYDHVRAHGFYPPYIWVNGEKRPLEGNPQADAAKMSEQGNEPVGAGGKTYSQEVFIQDILSYIRKHKDEPFFLYHPTQLPHGPVAIPKLHPDFINHPTMSLAEKKYASMIKMLDEHVGLIMQELKNLDLDEKTVVLFTADNGHEMYYGPKPSYRNQINAQGEQTNLTLNKWRTSESGDIFDGAGGRAGLKRSGYQGGVQLPMIVRWPGKIQPGSTTDLLTAQYDILPTVAELTGGIIPDGKDGISFVPTLRNDQQSQQHDYIIINNGFRAPHLSRACLISGEGWKLVEIDRNEDLFQLYRLPGDNEERVDLADKQSTKVAELKAILLAALDSERPDL